MCVQTTSQITMQLYTVDKWRGARHEVNPERSLCAFRVVYTVQDCVSWGGTVNGNAARSSISSVWQCAYEHSTFLAFCQLDDHPSCARPADYRPLTAAASTATSFSACEPRAGAIRRSLDAVRLQSPKHRSVMTIRGFIRPSNDALIRCYISPRLVHLLRTVNDDLHRNNDPTNHCF